MKCGGGQILCPPLPFEKFFEKRLTKYPEEVYTVYTPTGYYIS